MGEWIGSHRCISFEASYWKARAGFARGQARRPIAGRASRVGDAIVVIVHVARMVVLHLCGALASRFHHCGHAVRIGLLGAAF